MESGEQLDPMYVGECHRVLLIEDRDADVVAFHRFVHDRRLPIELQRARNPAEAVAMLLLQLECGRTGELLILLNLDLPREAAVKFLVDLRRNEVLAEAIVVGYTSALPPFGEDVASLHGLVSCLHPTAEGEQSATAMLGQFVESFLHLRV
ncbi:MAG: hypothetical protein ACI89X_000586 [Planctomycetota bacterium]|jgi:hypothetical protein